MLDLAHRIARHAIGLLYKVLPTAVVAAAMRPSITRRELEIRADAMLDVLAAAGANIGVPIRREAVERAARGLLVARGIIVLERGGRFRVRERSVLRYYARTHSSTCCSPRRAGRTH